MIRLITMVLFIIWILKKLKKITGSNLVKRIQPLGETITINEYEDVKSESENNIEKLINIKKTLIEMIINQLEKENLKEVKKLLYQLEIVIDQIQEHKNNNNKLLSLKVKNISKKLFNKVDGYLD